LGVAQIGERSVRRCDVVEILQRNPERRKDESCPPQRAANSKSAEEQNGNSEQKRRQDRKDQNQVQRKLNELQHVPPLVGGTDEKRERCQTKGRPATDASAGQEDRQRGQPRQPPDGVQAGSPEPED